MRKPSSLDQTLRQLQALHAVVSPSGQVWAPGARIPRYLLDEVQAHRGAVRRRIQQASIYTCPTPDLHRSEWSYQGGRYQCDACKQLNKAILTA